MSRVTTLCRSEESSPRYPLTLSDAQGSPPPREPITSARAHLNAFGSGGVWRRPAHTRRTFSTDLHRLLHLFLSPLAVCAEFQTRGHDATDGSCTLGFPVKRELRARAQLIITHLLCYKYAIVRTRRCQDVGTDNTHVQATPDSCCHVNHFGNTLTASRLARRNPQRERDVLILFHLNVILFGHIFVDVWK